MGAFTPLQKGTPNWHERYNADFETVHTGLDGKAGKDYVDQQVAGVAENPAVQEVLNKKADKTYVDTELAKKANATTVAAKADKTYVDAELGKKANTSELTSAVDTLNTALSQKANQSDLDALVSQVEGMVSAVRFTATITANWTGSAAPFTQTVSVSGILASDVPRIFPSYSTDLPTRRAQEEAFNMVSMVSAAANSLTFTCFWDKPAIAIPITIEVIR